MPSQVSSTPAGPTDQQIDALLDADEAAGSNPLILHALINERRRKRGWQRDKDAQQPIGFSALVADAVQAYKAKPSTADSGPDPHGRIWERMYLILREPIKPGEVEEPPGALEFLLQDVDDMLASQDFDDLIYAMARVVRKAVLRTPQIAASWFAPPKQNGG